MTRLPASFTSLYRLVLRTSSSAVLHKKSATKHLRHLWRTPFETAASIIRKMEGGSSKDEMQYWLDIWERRVDNTLSLMYNSSQTRGLSHQLTRNLTLLLDLHINDISPSRLKAWDSQQAEYLIKPPSPPSKKRDVELLVLENAKGHAFGALNRVVRMAEARDGLVLGTAKPKRRIY